MKEEKYLSDEELLRLISDVEKNELINAPCDLAEKIMAQFEEEEKTKQIKLNQEEKAFPLRQNKEYIQYCFRVFTSVAAAILILFSIPSLPDVETASRPSLRIFAEQEEGKERDKKNISGALLEVFDSRSIFTGDNRFKFFTR